MALLVQKFGGSSLANADLINNVAARIASSRDQGHQVVAVVSAMGDTTDDLIRMANRISDNPDPREMDVLLSTGELVSATLLAMALRARGCDAISLSGAQAGIRTDSRFGKAMIANVAPERLLRELDRGRIVIVAGFQGVTEDMDVTTLGRGASDTTAVALAAGIGADRCEVYTDVEGIFTADPRQTPKAWKLDEIGFEEMLELASYGAKMNPRSIEIGMVYNVPILVASSFSDAPGTLIHAEVDMNAQVGEIRNKVRGIATDINVGKVTVRGVPDRPGLAANIFEPLAAAEVSVDVIVQNASLEGATDLTFTVERPDLRKAREVVLGLADELGCQDVVTSDRLAKISIVGTGIQNAPGYASRMFRALADGGINIEMITTSEIRITCIVDENNVAKAARVLHTTFDLDVPE